MTIVIKWVEEVEPPVHSINFVLTEKNKNIWHSIYGKDTIITLCPEPVSVGGVNGQFAGLPRGKVGQLAEDILNFEVYSSSMTLMHRYFKARDMFKSPNCEVTNRDHIAYFYVWLRYSFMRQLDWQRRYNTKPRELQHAQQCLIEEMSHQLRVALESPQNSDEFLSSADLIRAMFSFIGKGSGNGQQVRDEILHIMHRHKIKETAGHFYEEWHQKLHNNTTPDDIFICEALLAFLRSGNLGDYWNHLNKNGITRERLASYDRKIVTEPWMKKEAIPDFENYLRILKQMHSSDDLNMLIEEARRHVGGDTHNLMNDIQQNFNDHDVIRQMDRVYSLRANLVHHHLDRNNVAKLKDVIFLDLCLESYTR